VNGRAKAVNGVSTQPIGPASQPEAGEGFLQARTTEHFTLQTARAVAVNEGNGRTALYVGTLSSRLVAARAGRPAVPAGRGLLRRCGRPPPTARRPAGRHPARAATRSDGLP
jgi:hypothetical protein